MQDISGIKTGVLFGVRFYGDRTMKNFSITVLGTATVVFLVSLLYLTSQAVNDSSQVIPQKWYLFEPDEQYTLDGSANFLEDRAEQKYYNNVSTFLSRTGNSENSLGVRFSWDRRGHNHVDIAPEKRIRYSGKIKSANVWVWGGGYRHSLALIFNRQDGYSYGVSLGQLNFNGWKRLSAEVPALVSKPTSLAGQGKLFFNSFRVLAHPKEKVNDIYVFLDLMEVDEALDFSTYDGSDLEEIIFEELSGEASEQESSGN